MIKFALLILLSLYSAGIFADYHVNFLGASIPEKLILEGTTEKVSLQGYASNYQQGSPFYVGALLTSQAVKEPSMLLFKDLSMAMIFFFLQDDIPREKIIRIFTEELLLNNPGWDHVPLNKARLTELRAAFEIPFHAGDKIIFEYTSEDQLILLINNAKVKTWQNSRSLFNAILRIWIGQYPPSREFKENILGKQK